MANINCDCHIHDYKCLINYLTDNNIFINPYYQEKPDKHTHYISVTCSTENIEICLSTDLQKIPIISIPLELKNIYLFNLVEQILNSYDETSYIVFKEVNGGRRYELVNDKKFYVDMYLLFYYKLIQLTNPIKSAYK